MTFNEGIMLIKKIYKEVDNCTSELCKCIKWVYLENTNTNGFGAYVEFFRNETNLNEATSFLSSFVYNYMPFLKSMSDLQNMYSQESFFPTLAKFAVRVDFSKMRTNFYNYIWQSGHYKYNSTVFK